MTRTRTGRARPGARATPAAAPEATAIAAGLATFALACLWLGLTFPTGALDRAVAAFALGLRSAQADRVAVLVTMAGDADLLLWTMLATVATLAAAGRGRLAADAAILFLATPLAVAALKLAIGRPRPPSPFALPDAFAFPSGHATGAAVMLGALAALCLADRPHARPGVRALVWGAAAAGALGVALSRVWLAAHWLSDTVAALGLALALSGWFAARARTDAASLGPGGANPLLGPWLVAGYGFFWAVHVWTRFADASGLYAGAAAR